MCVVGNLDVWVSVSVVGSIDVWVSVDGSFDVCLDVSVGGKFGCVSGCEREFVAGCEWGESIDVWV